MSKKRARRSRHRRRGRDGDHYTQINQNYFEAGRGPGPGDKIAGLMEGLDVGSGLEESKRPELTVSGTSGEGWGEGEQYQNMTGLGYFNEGGF